MKQFILIQFTSGDRKNHQPPVLQTPEVNFNRKQEFRVSLFKFLQILIT